MEESSKQTLDSLKKLPKKLLQENTDTNQINERSKLEEEVSKRILIENLGEVKVSSENREYFSKEELDRINQDREEWIKRTQKDSALKKKSSALTETQKRKPGRPKKEKDESAIDSTIGLYEAQLKILRLIKKRFFRSRGGKNSEKRWKSTAVRIAIHEFANYRKMRESQASSLKPLINEFAKSLELWNQSIDENRPRPTRQKMLQYTLYKAEQIKDYVKKSHIIRSDYLDMDLESRRMEEYKFSEVEEFLTKEELSALYSACKFKNVLSNPERLDSSRILS